MIAVAERQGTSLLFLRSLAVWLFAALYWTVAIPIHLLSLRHDRLFQRMARWWARASLKLIHVELHFENESTLEDRRSRVVIVNHQSGLDLIWGAAITPPAPLAIGKREVIFIPIVNLIWWGLGFIRIDRKNTAAALERLRGVGSRIADDKRSLMIAPEGTRTEDGTIGRFKKGAFHIAAARATPIYPVVVQGAFECLHKGEFTFKPGTVRVRYLPPIPTDGWADLPKQEFEARVEGVRQVMIRALSDMEDRARADLIAR